MIFLATQPTDDVSTLANNRTLVGVVDQNSSVAALPIAYFNSFALLRVLDAQQFIKVPFHLREKLPHFLHQEVVGSMEAIALLTHRKQLVTAPIAVTVLKVHLPTTYTKRMSTRI